MTSVIKLMIPDLPSADELLPFLRRIDANRWYTNFGPLSQEFEATLKARFFAGLETSLVLTSNGTSALELGVQALRLAPGGRVLLPSFTFPATLTAVLRAGLVPVFSDVDPDSWQLTPDIAMRAISEGRIDLVLTVATFGNPVDAAGWSAFMAATGVPVLVDAAAALGAQQVSVGPVWCFSLHATKPFACGEGGVVVSADAEYIDEVRAMSNFGIRPTGGMRMLGTNAKISEYHAAIGLAQFVRWDDQCRRRRELGAVYRKRLAGVVDFQRYEWEMIPSVMPVRLPEAVSLQRCESQLALAGIMSRRWYTPPLHMLVDLQGHGFETAGAEYPVTSDLVARCIGLPFHTSLLDDDQEKVCLAIHEIIGASRA